MLAAWCGVTAIGVAGWIVQRAGYRVAGLAALAVWGALGLDGFGHYRLAPLTAHSFTMNLTIWLEGIAGAIVALTFGWSLRAGRARAGALSVPLGARSG